MHLRPPHSGPGGASVVHTGGTGASQNTGSVSFSTLRCGTLESPGCDHNTQNLGRIPETGADPGAAHLLWGAGRRRRQPRAQSPRAYPEPAPQAREQRRRGRHLALTLRWPRPLARSLPPLSGTATNGIAEIRRVDGNPRGTQRCVRSALDVLLLTALQTVLGRTKSEFSHQAPRPLVP